MTRLPLLVVSMCLLAPLARAQQNVLVIVADDVGTDLIAAYGEHPVPGHTPVIDSLAANGVLFRNAWTNPVCSPSRSGMLTGRHAFRTGIGYAIQYWADSIELYPDEVTIADVLAPTYETAAVGKWHLTSKVLGDAGHPQAMGFDHFRGNLTGFKTWLPWLTGNGYSSFYKFEDGVGAVADVYNTTDIVDDALELIDSFDGPWFVWMAFNAPHIPYHKPPANLHTYNLPESVSSSWPLHARAMLEAMDTELGRLFAQMDPAVLANTLIVFAGDNGTSKYAVLPPSDPAKAKETMYEGGLNVPLIVSGPGVARGAECKALVGLTDLFATVAEVGGYSPTTGADSVSLVPYFSQPDLPSQREWVYSEMTKTVSANGQFAGYGPYAKWYRAIRDQHYKLIWEMTSSWTPDKIQFFDLAADPTESNDLFGSALGPVAQQEYQKLTQFMNDVIPTWLDVGRGLAGVQGTPVLKGQGELVPGLPVAFELTSAAPNAPTFLISSLKSITTPLAGGVVVPAIDLITQNLVTDSTGRLVIQGNWLPGIPSGSRAYFQHWTLDPSAPGGFSASNALVATIP